MFFNNYNLQLSQFSEITVYFSSPTPYCFYNQINGIKAYAQTKVI